LFRQWARTKVRALFLAVHPAAVKDQLKRMLARMGWSLHRVRPGFVSGLDLGRDLHLVVGNKPAPLCVDVGAHDGTFIQLIQSRFRSPRIHAFEPAPEPFARLRENHGSDPGVTLVNGGLGGENGQILFNIYPNQSLNSFLTMLPSGAAVLGDGKASRTITVPVQRLDDYAAAAGLEAIDLLKIDTQGYELKVLGGACRLLESGNVRTVVVELNFAPLYEGQVRSHEVVGFLHDRGFRMVDLYEKCRLNPFLGWCTAVFALQT
jgi:FkbM family methyltransferase